MISPFFELSGIEICILVAKVEFSETLSAQTDLAMHDCVELVSRMILEV